MISRFHHVMVDTATLKLICELLDKYGVRHLRPADGLTEKSFRLVRDILKSDLNDPEYPAEEVDATPASKHKPKPRPETPKDPAIRYQMLKGRKRP